jgi:hypothetical protein
MVNKKANKETKLKFSDIFGWYGMCALIISYILVSLRVLDADGLIYQLLNITGAIGLLIVAESKHVIQSVITNLFWALIGVVIIFRILFGII